MFQLQHWQFFSFSLGFLFFWKPCAAGRILGQVLIANIGSQHVFFDLGFFEFTGVSRWGPLGMSRLVTAWDSFETETDPEKKTTGNSRPGFGHVVGPGVVSE